MHVKCSKLCSHALLDQWETHEKISMVYPEIHGREPSKPVTSTSFLSGQYGSFSSSMEQNLNHGRVIGHSGAQIGCSSFLFLLPDKNACLAVIANTSGSLQQVSNIAGSMMDIIGNE